MKWFHRGSRLLVPFLVAWSAGCQEYNWRNDIEGLEQQAREQGKDVFIFYKYWLDQGSSDMLSVELSDPQVKALFQDTINVLIDKDYGPRFEKFMERYGVTSYPASVIVRPDGKPKVLFGRVPKEQFIKWATEAKSPPGGGNNKTKPAGP